MTQSPAAIDDDKFEVVRAAKLSREKLRELQQFLMLDRQAIDARLTWTEGDEETWRRRGQQLRWIDTQFGKLRDAEKAANRRAHDKGKKLRRSDFYETFFFVCKGRLDRSEFKDLCETAAARAGEGPKPEHEHEPIASPPGVLHDGDVADSA